MTAANKILIVEDEKLTRHTLELPLKKKYDVTTADSAESALELFKVGYMPDLVLLDFTLPGISGVEFCRIIKEDPSTKSIPVIFLTASIDSECEELCLKAGAVDFLRKPATSFIIEARVGLQLKRQEILSIPTKKEPPTKKKSLMDDLRQFATSNVKGQSEDECTSRVHLINLDPIKEAFANRWAQIEQKVIVITDSIISSNLSKGETYKYFGENIFAVIYPTLKNAEGKVRARVTAEKICRKLLGEEFDKGRFGTDIVDRILAYEVQEEKSDEEKEANKNEMLIRRKVISAVTIEYQPVWNPEKRTIDAYRASFCRTYNGKTLYGRNILHGGSSDLLWPDVYDVMFDDIAKRISQNTGTCPLYMVTLHLDFLMSKHFVGMMEKYLARPGLRKNLVIEVVGIDDHIKLSTTKAIVVLLRNLCDTILVRISPDSLVASEIKMFGIRHIGFNFFDLSQIGLGQRGAYVVAAHFCKKANALGFETYVWGVDRVPDFQIMSKVNFGIMSGNVFKMNDQREHMVYPLSPALIIKSSV